MSTVSVPLSGDLISTIEHFIQQGVASNKAEFIRMAIKKYAEQQAVNLILQAQNEPDLSGDLDVLASNL